jgi:subtilisin family serine protease
MRRFVALLWVLVAVFGTGAATAGAAEQPATVTLITGDRVTLTPSSGVIFDPAPGSERTGFDVLRDGSHVHVIPDDVAPLVPDVLDPALFDVTALVEMGYDDRSTDALPLIVRRAGEARGGASPLRTVEALESIRATAVALDKDEAARFGDDLARPNARAAAGVSRVWLDRKIEAAALDGYLTQVKAPAAWSAGLDGTGVTVAVLDTGVDDGHPALAGQVTTHANFTDAASPADGNGHGTHVASLVAGTGAGSDGARQGIATGAKLLSGKVLGDNAEGLGSWLIAGMEWAAAQGADVVNVSAGGAPTFPDDPLVQALDNLTAQTGTLFVVAAGNRGGLGGAPFSIETPGSAASALTVGAVTATDALAFFSSQGPTLGGYRLKPEVTAPGVGILGARAGARDSGLYVPMSGTSQATPIVAGAAALLLQQHPDWSWQRIKSQIVGTADPHPAQTSWTHGGGRLDLDQATHQELTADVATLGFGYVRHPDDAPQTRTVTLTNDGAEPVSLVISDQVRSDDGVAAPDAALVANPATLTVPAGGSASTTVTLDPGLIADGLWEGAMSFDSGGTTVVRLPFGVYDEPEMYDLEVQMLDRNGEPYDPATGAGDPNGDTTIPIFDGESGSFYRLRPDANGRASARIAPGTYSIFGRIITPAGDGERETFTIAGTPGLEVRSDTEYVIDAREARRVRPPVIPDQETEPRIAVGLTYSRESESRGYTEFGFFDPEEVSGGRLYITPTGRVDAGSFETTFRWRLEPVGKVRPRSPDVYELLFNAPRFENPLTPQLTRRDVADMARVDSTYRPVGPGEHLATTVYQTVETGVGFVFRTPQPVPASTYRLATASPDVLWGQCMAVPVNAYRELCDDLRPYESRERVDVQFGATLHPEAWAARHSPQTMFFQTGLSDGQHMSVLHPDAMASNRLTLYKDGALVGSQDALAAFFPVPDEAGRFRLEQEWTLPDAFPRSRTARTAWTYDSAPPSDPSQGGSTTPPFLSLDYGADVDGFGRAEARRPLRLDLRVGHVSGADAPERIEHLRLWWSVDGGDTWEPERVTRTGRATFRGKVPGGALRSGRSLSLRVVAIDADGNEIDQAVPGIIPVR